MPKIRGTLLYMLLDAGQTQLEPHQADRTQECAMLDMGMADEWAGPAGGYLHHVHSEC